MVKRKYTLFSSRIFFMAKHNKIIWSLPGSKFTKNRQYSNCHLLNNNDAKREAVCKNQVHPTIQQPAKTFPTTTLIFVHSSFHRCFSSIRFAGIHFFVSSLIDAFQSVWGLHFDWTIAAL
ncbi:hypothetical protein ILYODFUR_013524 [Ilyodon furcidens]|uniref:Uncharacterized protein n=1 Tax=Ilyodon furcidens TaxID=33524 RepID=A0ABV0UJZ5_9TELE